MKKAAPKILAVLWAWLAVFPSEGDGLRNMKIGDALPATEAMKAFGRGQDKLLLCLDSDRGNNVRFLAELVAAVGDTAGLKLFVIDVRGASTAGVVERFDAWKGAKQMVPDRDRTIFGELGVIVLPTLLFVDKDNVLRSYVSAYRSNLSLIFKSNSEALAKGIPPEDLSRIGERTGAQRSLDRLLEQGFHLMADGDYALAESIYRKAAALDAENETARLGWGYALLFQDKLAESMEHFSAMRKTNDSRQAQLGYFLSRAMQAGDAEALDRLAALSTLETRLFFVVFRAAAVLDKAGKTAESKNAYRHAYEVLLRLYGSLL